MRPFPALREPAAPTPKPAPSRSLRRSSRCAADDETASPDQFNELGVRKYDLPALFDRLRHHFSRPAASNPRLVTYLAAGGVHGLRPLRYEKRVARNRFILLVVILLVVLFGIFSVFIHHR